MEWETLKVEEHGPVVHLVLNRPQVRNAINNQLLEDMVSACHAIDAMPACRCVILRGEGKGFCAGADLKEGVTHQRGSGPVIQRAKVGARAINALSELTPVTIATVHGHAIGGGVCLAMACDFRIGAESARISIREASLGLHLAWNSLPNVVHLVGPAKAKEMVFFGESYDPETMLRYGFFDQVVPDAELATAGEAMAQRVLRQPPLSVQAAKVTINALVKSMDRAVCNMDEFAVTFTGATKDARAAREAFFSGATPEWQAE